MSQLDEAILNTTSKCLGISKGIILASLERRRKNGLTAHFFIEYHKQCRNSNRQRGIVRLSTPTNPLDMARGSREPSLSKMRSALVKPPSLKQCNFLFTSDDAALPSYSKRR